ncbi:uncharacterized protein LOC135609837 isoform X2 [Musa acuminata AAA Group]|uniref:uncharacterized protein LOC135609837 isoform X2 n=1 Tax=Musa acuminata AAA Group TaxID=214697 RepID=UPI0031D1BBEC
MASIVCFTSAVNSITSPSKASSSTSGLSPKSNLPFPNPTHHGAVSRFQPLRVKATESSTNSGTKRNSIVCADCDGNVVQLAPDSVPKLAKYEQGDNRISLREVLVVLTNFFRGL